MSILRFPSAVLVGATLMYFLDPARGRKRRARLGELATHARRVERRLVGKGVRDAQHRARGITERLAHPLADEIADGVLHARVRAALGRAISHARAIEVEASCGRVVLRGPVLAAEHDAAIASIQRIPGVHQLVDRLDCHASADVPALQGARKRGRGEHWPPAARLAAIGAGTALATYGLLVRRGAIGVALVAAGGALALRGGIDESLAHAFGRAGFVTVHKTIMVNAPIDRVFALWSRFETFPKFMEHVRAIEVVGTRSRWKVDGPAGIAIEFDAELVRREDNKQIAWRAVPGQVIDHAGSVRFEDAGDHTRVSVELSYRPPGGKLGHAIAHVLGWDPKARLDDDLVRMKAILEDGFTRAHHARIAIEDLS
jgi:uncharacterized membrane protein